MNVVRSYLPTEGKNDGANERGKNEGTKDACLCDMVDTVLLQIVSEWLLDLLLTRFLQADNQRPILLRTTRMILFVK